MDDYIKTDLGWESSKPKHPCGLYLLGNFPRWDEIHFMTVIEFFNILYPEIKIYIKRNAYCTSGKLVPYHLALVTSHNSDLAAFWEIDKAIRKNASRI